MTIFKSDYYYDLPKELIAQQPVTPRDHSKMMIYNREAGGIEHSIFCRFPDVLEENSVLVVNNSKVIPARLLGNRKSGAGCELLLIREIESDVWECKARNVSRVKIGEILEFCDGSLHGELMEKKESGTVLLRFEYQGNFYQLLETHGFAPVPPYIHKAREETVDRKEDLIQYQTVYAQQYGAIAAPTAGLHFTENVLNRITQKSIETVEITLHVGLGTFEPIRVDDVSQHQMHTEHYEISQAAADKIAEAKRDGRKIVAVGTTSVRALESAWEKGALQVGKHSTDIFIHPPYQFNIVDQLLTNFHLPESTLLMLIAALIGKDSVLTAYQSAIAEEYRFYSFGDCMFIK